MNKLPDDVLRISIDTRDDPPARIALDWAQQAVAYFQDTHGLEDGQVVIRHLGQGTTSLELFFMGLAAFASVGGFAAAYVAHLKEGEQRVATPTLTIINAYGGSTVTVCHGTAEPETVRREEIRVVHRLEPQDIVTKRPDIGRPTLTQGPSPQRRPSQSDGPVSTSKEGPATDDKPTDQGSGLAIFEGTLVDGVDGLEFRMTTGAKALVDEIASGLEVPRNTPIAIDARVGRGSRGGLADPRLTILDWRNREADRTTNQATDGRPVTMLGTFRLEDIRDYYFDSEGISYFVDGPTSNYPLGSTRMISATLYSGERPEIIVHAMTSINEDGTEGGTVEISEHRPGPSGRPNAAEPFDRKALIRGGARLTANRVGVPGVEPLGVRRTVHFVGKFRRKPDGGYLFIRADDGAVFNIVGVDPRLEFPTPGQYSVSGSIDADPKGASNLFPVDITLISKD